MRRETANVCGAFVRSKKCCLERVKGIEPSSLAWEAIALPLSYTRIVEQSLPRIRPFGGCVRFTKATTAEIIQYLRRYCSDGQESTWR